MAANRTSRYRDVLYRLRRLPGVGDQRAIQINGRRYTMASILKLKAKLLQKSLSLKSLNGLRRAVRVPTDALLLATSVLL